MIMAANLDNTIKAFQSGITTMSPDQGVKSIDEWLKKLENADFRGAKSIHDSLSKLKKHLESGNLDGAAIGELLSKLGDATVRAAGQASGKDADKIKQLGQALSDCGDEMDSSSAKETPAKGGSTKRGSSAAQRA
jgi:hypothetical protein